MGKGTEKQHMKLKNSEDLSKCTLALWRHIFTHIPVEQVSVQTSMYVMIGLRISKCKYPSLSSVITEVLMGQRIARQF